MLKRILCSAIVSGTVIVGSALASAASQEQSIDSHVPAWKVERTKAIIDEFYLYRPVDWSKCTETLVAMLGGYATHSRVNDGGQSTCFDMFTQYFRPSATKRFNDAFGGEYAGVGMEVRGDVCKTDIPGLPHCPVTVVGVRKGSSAEMAGILPGDTLASVPDSLDVPFPKRVGLLTPSQAARAIRGRPGSEVSLEIYRAGEVRTIALERKVLELPAAVASQIGDACYVRTVRFTSFLADDINEAIAENCDGLHQGVLDLRYNPGGSAEAAKEVDYLLSRFSGRVSMRLRDQEGERVFTLGRPFPDEPCSTPEEPVCLTYFYRHTGKAKPIGLFANWDWAALINGAAASASEAVAGFLQSTRGHGPDLGEGERILIGTPTFGKNVGQSTFLLGPDQSALHLTKAEFIAGDRESVPPGTPIVPDINVPDPSPEVLGDPERDGQLIMALTWLRQKEALRVMHPAS